jgi:20S proteasome subunit beta 3
VLFFARMGPYFVSPVIAGLDKISETEYRPVVATYDSIGCLDDGGDFQVAGTGNELLYGVAETFYKPDMGPEELFETISNCLLSALDRDSLSGWGAYVYILTPGELIVRALKTRQD